MSDPSRESVHELSELGFVAFTTTRAAGTFGTVGTDPVGEVMGRWWSLVESLQAFGPRFATARQVHGNRVLVHRAGWDGLIRASAADGHVAAERGTALAVTIADCVPVFVAHPGGATALLHAGWRGTAARILEAGVRELQRLGLAPRDLHVHLGPAICGRCYQVGTDVYAQLTGQSVDGPRCVDLRAILAAQAAGLGVTHVSASAVCTRCDNERFFSHRAGDAGRALAVMVSPVESRAHAP